VGLLLAPPVSAEISAECDEDGRFVRMIYRTNASSKNVRIWSVSRNPRPNVFPLNPAGDDRMDLWPYHVENPYDGNRPYVVWSRFNGNDYDLVWSRWTSGGWTPVEWVERSMRSGAEQDANMETHPETGRPHLVWWSDEGGIGRIYLSLFLNTRWMDRFLVSDFDTDSRYPVIEFPDQSRIMVSYETVDGPVSRIIVFISPHTITDDIDPMTHLSRELQSSQNGR
jgi:hypothetical protein